MIEYIHLKKNYISVERKNSNHDILPSFGGSQSWFADDDAPLFSKGRIICSYGCGLISSADILYYLTHKEVDGIDYERYCKYIFKMKKKYFPIFPMFGTTGYNLSWGMNKYFREKNLPFRAKWCASGKKMLGRIKEMLLEDIPVTFSIGPSVFQGVTFYELKPKRGQYYNFVPDDLEGKVKGHYVTVIGVLEDDWKGDIWLEVSSWGRKYYIDFKEYKKAVLRGSCFLFSNILYIGRC